MNCLFFQLPAVESYLLNNFLFLKMRHCATESCCIYTIVCCIYDCLLLMWLFAAYMAVYFLYGLVCCYMVCCLYGCLLLIWLSLLLIWFAVYMAVCFLYGCLLLIWLFASYITVRCLYGLVCCLYGLLFI